MLILPPVTARTTLALGLVAACLAVAPLSPASAAALPCTGSMLSGTFKAIPNSEGAGNIVYRLRVRNTSHVTCFVTGIPQLQLLAQNGKKLPTKTIFDGPAGTLTAIVVPLAHGAGASLTARFSPDVPGPGEPVTKACEKTAYRLRVSPSGGGTVTVPVLPPTPVCEHGTLQLKTFTGA